MVIAGYLLLLQSLDVCHSSHRVPAVTEVSLNCTDPGYPSRQLCLSDLLSVVYGIVVCSWCSARGWWLFVALVWGHCLGNVNSTR